MNAGLFSKLHLSEDWGCQVHYKVKESSISDISFTTHLRITKLCNPTFVVFLWFSHPSHLHCSALRLVMRDLPLAFPQLSPIQHCDSKCSSLIYFFGGGVMTQRLIRAWWRLYFLSCQILTPNQVLRGSSLEIVSSLKTGNS